MTSEPGPRFALLIDEDFQDLLNNRLSAGSKSTIKSAVNLLSEYARSRSSCLADVEQLPVADLDRYLSRYFAEIRKKDGSMFAQSSVLINRYGLRQHFKKIRGFDIVSDSQFKSFQKMFPAVLVGLKAAGKRVVQHKEPLSAEDFNKLYYSSVLSTDTPCGLQNKVFVDIMVHLCKRGHENLREMKWTDFTIQADSTGNRYVQFCDFLTKNHRGESVEEASEQGRMYENPGNPKCPVMAFEKYMAALNKDFPAFWQQPNPNFDPQNSTYWYWYWKAPLGLYTLLNKMSSLSIAAGLSTKYTNNCLRATCITILDQSGFEARQIMSVSGKKSKASIRSCSRNVADSTRRDMSLVLTKHMTGHTLVGINYVEQQIIKVEPDLTQEVTNVAANNRELVTVDVAATSIQHPHPASSETRQATIFIMLKMLQSVRSVTVDVRLLMGCNRQKLDEQQRFKRSRSYTVEETVECIVYRQRGDVTVEIVNLSWMGDANVLGSNTSVISIDNLWNDIVASSSFIIESEAAVSTRCSLNSSFHCQLSICQPTTTPLIAFIICDLNEIIPLGDRDSLTGCGSSPPGCVGETTQSVALVSSSRRPIKPFRARSSSITDQTDQSPPSETDSQSSDLGLVSESLS